MMGNMGVLDLMAGSVDVTLRIAELYSSDGVTLTHSTATFLPDSFFSVNDM